MPFEGNGWRPTRITRFIRSFGSATATALVDTDNGEGYLKALGNPEGPHALACELVGSLLAEWLGLRTLDFSLVHLTGDDEIPLRSGDRAQPGHAFISRAEKQGFNWGGTIKELRSLVNPSEISGLVVIDTWLLNCDRRAPDGRRVNRDNVFLVQQTEKKSDTLLMAIDFTHAFTCGNEINRRLGFIEKIRDAKIYGLFPEFKNFLDREEVRRLADHLGRFSRPVAEKFISLVPEEWEVSQQGRAAWATLITERAHFISENIEEILWPQLALEGGTE